MNKDKLVIVGIVVALVFSGFALFNGPQDGVNGRDGIGGAAGPYHTETQQFAGSYSVPGTMTSTTTVDSSITLDASHLRREVSLMSMNIGEDTTITTMASTSQPLVGLRSGEYFVTYFYNASTTAGSAATFAAGTGVDLQEDEGETVVVNGLEMARLTFQKKADSDISLILEVFQVGD